MLGIPKVKHYSNVKQTLLTIEYNKTIKLAQDLVLYLINSVK